MDVPESPAGSVRQTMNERRKIVVLDDDPTGSQTVHGCLLLTRWEPEELRAGLLDPSPLLFILTNSRSLTPEKASAVTREVCRGLKTVLGTLHGGDACLNPVIVSRSDSTLRGHYPLETDVIAGELGPFDAHFLVPAFFEGGRITRDSTHYLKSDRGEIPVHETVFAQDSVFGYRNSFLPAWVEEKTSGRIRAEDVKRYRLQDLNGTLLDSLLSLRGNRCCVVDSTRQAEMDLFARDALSAIGQGKKFLFRSAASFLTSLAQLPLQPVPPAEMHRLVRNARPGAVLVGSHVKRTTDQLGHLLRETGLPRIEIDVERLPKQFNHIVEEVVHQASVVHRGGQTCVIYTSRAEKVFLDKEARLEFGERISDLLVTVVRRLPETLGFLVSKGGITSHDVLSHGLSLGAARLLGQIIPGCSVVRCPEDHARYPGLPLVIFPGNVGDETALLRVYQILSTASNLHISRSG